MSGTRESGKKAAAKTRQKYGVGQVKEWGKRAHANPNRTYVGGMNNPEKAQEIAKLGGSAGHRTRKITPEDKLRPDEWGLLLKAINTTAGRIRLDGSETLDAMDQHLIYHKVFDYWAKEDWVGAMTEICDHPAWEGALGETLDELADFYKGAVKTQPRLSYDRELFRVYNNLRAAYRAALKVKHEKESH